MLLEEKTFACHLSVWKPALDSNLSYADSICRMGCSKSTFVEEVAILLTYCLKRPSFYCLIHFYKRCVSALAWTWSLTFEYISGWVSVFVSHKPCLCRAKESPLNSDIKKAKTKKSWTVCSEQSHNCQHQVSGGSWMITVTYVVSSCESLWVHCWLYQVVINISCFIHLIRTWAPHCFLSSKHSFHRNQVSPTGFPKGRQHLLSLWKFSFVPSNTWTFQLRSMLMKEHCKLHLETQYFVCQ